MTEKNTPPLKVEIHAIGDLLIGRILYQDDTRIRRGMGLVYKDDETGIEIQSQGNPAFSPGKPNLFYIRGTGTSMDCKYFVGYFKSEKEAKKFAADLKTAIKNLVVNNGCCPKKELAPGTVERLM